MASEWHWIRDGFDDCPLKIAPHSEFQFGPEISKFQGPFRLSLARSHAVARHHRPRSQSGAPLAELSARTHRTSALPLPLPSSPLSSYTPTAARPPPPTHADALPR